MSEWTPDTLTNIIVSPNFQWGKGSSESGRMGASLRRDPYELLPSLTDALGEWSLVPDSIKVNRRLGATHSTQDDVQASGSVQVNRRLKKRGRTILSCKFTLWFW